RRKVLRAGTAIGAAALGMPRFGRAADSGVPGISPPLADTATAGVLVWNVDALGYEAHEYFLTGRANVYKPVSMADAPDVASRDNLKDLGRRDFSRELLSAAVPFTTRLIVYRPQDKRRFSGNVIVETLHPNGGGASVVWNAVHDYFAAGGDAYVGVQHPLTMAGLKAADPGRYAQLNAADPTQLWGMLAQAGAAIKTQGASSPLAGYPVKHLLMTGYSYTGVATATFANYHHEEAKLENGRNIFAGYLPMADAQYVKPLDVPVMRLNTQSDFNGFGGLNNRRPDDDRYRHYEIAGASHVAIPPPPGAGVPPAPGKVPTPSGQPHFSPTRCQIEFPAGSHPNDYPLYLVQAALFANMYSWIGGGKLPPPSAMIETNADGSCRLDDYGNALGGVRYPQVAVPVAAYGVGNNDACLLFGYTAPFDAGRCRRIYGNQSNYLSKVRLAGGKLVADRLLLQDDLSKLVAIARTGASF
ncbi:MAG TPA: alpha/beta hydrolase domain-containing protein, partial [Steroidobacteraceae bacterium]